MSDEISETNSTEVVDRQWRARLAEHEGCSCSDREPVTGRCRAWKKIYVDYLGAALAELGSPLIGRG
jgi:hypothetical protein